MGIPGSSDTIMLYMSSEEMKEKGYTISNSSGNGKFVVSTKVTYREGREIHKISQFGKYIGTVSRRRLPQLEILQSKDECSDSAIPITRDNADASIQTEVPDQGLPLGVVGAV